ncbi:HDOD domain-containing protein [Dethiosulfatarculus sandiegensis]|nr:HDOD domain-containing protein [Dethiosulfatarculus sandiegensis]
MEQHEILAKMRSVIDELPQLPGSVNRILKVLEDPEAGVRKITEAVMPDPALTTKVLKVANSAYYGFSATIASVSRAVPLLGLETIKSLALSLGVFESMGRDQKDSELIPKNELWLHSLTVADTMVEMAKRLDVEAEYLFIMGFLHDVGKLVLARSFPDLYKECLDRAFEEGRDLSEIERKMIRFDHGEVGALLLTRWKFPKVLVNPVRFHHKDKLPSGPDTVDVAMVRVADALANRLLHGEDHPKSRIRQADLDYLELQQSELESLYAYQKEAEEKVSSWLAALN